MACFVLLFWSAPINAIVFASLFVGDGVADPIGRLVTSWLGAARCARAAPPAVERLPAAPGSGGATRRATRSGAAAAPASAEAFAAAAAEAVPEALPPPRRGDGGDGGKGVAKPLLPLQYQVFYFGVKSVPGSLAFFVGSLAAAVGWAALFRAAGHYGPDFSMGVFVAAAAVCIGVATVAEAISPPHVDNLLVTCAASLHSHKPLTSRTSSCSTLHHLATSDPLTPTCPTLIHAGTPRPPPPFASLRAESRRFCSRAARDGSIDRPTARERRSLGRGRPHSPCAHIYISTQCMMHRAMWVCVKIL